jgi:hypothetical protein
MKKHSVSAAAAARIRERVEAALLEHHNIRYQQLVDWLDQEGMANPESQVRALIALFPETIRAACLVACAYEAYAARAELQRLQRALAVIGQYIPSQEDQS